PDFARSDLAAERFLREARAAGNIEHENVVKVLDVGRDPEDNSLFLVLERLRGEDLSARLDKSPLKIVDAAPIFVPVMDALADAHELGIVHRDLKPENIFLHTGRKGRLVAKLLDFGIAKVSDDKGGRGTQTGTVIGTPWYMSPEQAAGDKSLGPASDVWSIAVVFYEA
ncbi:MAG: serine/threonine protein kinase, partial [Myxococcales bacterium]|nr:serine/threonine protein kinase [Myxococcales bacterium]